MLNDLFSYDQSTPVFGGNNYYEVVTRCDIGVIPKGSKFYKAYIDRDTVIFISKFGASHKFYYKIMAGDAVMELK